MNVDVHYDADYNTQILNVATEHKILRNMCINQYYLY